MPTSPLSPDDIQLIQQARHTLNDVVQLIIAAKACGVKCDAFQSRATQLMDYLTKMVEHFGPGGSYEKSGL